MMDEAYLLEHIKEQLCFVSQDVPADLALARRRASPHRCGPLGLLERREGACGRVCTWRAGVCAWVGQYTLWMVYCMAGCTASLLRLASCTPFPDMPTPSHPPPCAALPRHPPSFRREYVLPDGLTDTWGHVRTEEEAAAAAAAQQQQARQGGPSLPKQPVLVVNNERFMVPEALFHPSGASLSPAFFWFSFPLGCRVLCWF